MPASSEDILNALLGVSERMDRVLTTLERVADKLERAETVAPAIQEPSIAPTPLTVGANPSDITARRVIKSSLPQLDSCKAVLFYGPDKKLTHFLQDCVFFHMKSAAIVVYFTSPEDYDVEIKKRIHDADPYRRRAKESGCQAHLVFEFDCQGIGPHEIGHFGPHQINHLVDASVYVRKLDDSIIWELTVGGSVLNGTLLVGPA